MLAWRVSPDATDYEAVNPRIGGTLTGIVGSGCISSSPSYAGLLWCESIELCSCLVGNALIWSLRPNFAVATINLLVNGSELVAEVALDFIRRPSVPVLCLALYPFI